MEYYYEILILRHGNATILLPFFSGPKNYILLEHFRVRITGWGFRKFNIKTFIQDYI